MPPETGEPLDETVEQLKADLQAEKERQKAEEIARFKAEQEKAAAEAQQAVSVQEPAVATGTVIVLGNSHMQGHAVILTAVPLASPRFHQTIGIQVAGGRERMAALFRRVPEGTYSVHQASNYTKIDVWADEETIVDWSGERRFW